MRRSDTPINPQTEALNGARALDACPKRVWVAEGPGAKRTCQRAGAWMRVLMTSP